MGISQIVFTILLAASFGFFGYTVSKLLKLFSLTKPTFRLDKIGERILTTLIVAFGQSKMMKKPLSGILHAMVWWGFIVITLGTAEMMVDGVIGTVRIFSFLGPLYDFITASGEIFAFLIIVSCIIFLSRRYITKPKRFIAPEMKPSSRMDATFILAMILILMFSLIGMNLGYVVETTNNNPEAYVGAYPVSQLFISLFPALSTMHLHTFEMVNWWIHITLVLAFLNILPYSKHFHVIMSVPNVFLTRLEPKAKLNNLESVTKEVQLMMNPDTAFAAAPADAGEPPRFGVKDVEDVTWKTLFDSYTCTECGRCTDACPANTTGKKLSPRKLFIDLRRRMKDKGQGLLEDKNFSDGKSLISDDYISVEELWACTTCMACIEECPVNIDHVPFIVDMRRNLVMEESKMPSGWTAMMSNIENNGTPWKFSPSDRLNWANDVVIRIPN
jgi:heterodisulfide reductase subunit C/nitrate reductase gamma subunit